jgi:gentisate 1,2-dioxygenase
MVQSPAASASPAAVAAAAAPTDEAFNRLVHKYHMFGLWEQEEGVEPVPFPKTEAFMWPASIVNQLIEQAGHAVPVGNERRALQLFNPGFGGQFATTPTLVGAVQVLLPGETARAHRHSASAIRFITRGSGAYTRVNGERLYMSEGDLVLTPNWTWHDHNNDAAAPVVWMDGLDVPLVKYLDAWFFELYPDRQAADLLPPGISRRLYGHASLKPTWRQEQPSHSPLMLYSWRQTSEALAALRDQEGDPHDGVALEYTHPLSGGPVIPTMSCWIQLLRPGQHLKAHRHTGSAVYCAFKGNGTTVIDGQAFNWTEGSYIALPPWSMHEHINTSDEDALLFSIRDTPLLKAMGLYREEALTLNDGHQEVTSTFDIEARIAG